MTREEKQLLLKDLCSRLPYGVICEDMEGKTRPLFGITPTQHFVVTLDGTNNGLKFCTIDCVKPYLRPMSSMTEDERKEFKDTFKGFFQYFNRGIISDSRVWDKNEAVFVGELSCSRLIDWLNAHHFDYRGLIERGLAIEVTKDNNPYEEH